MWFGTGCQGKQGASSTASTASTTPLPDSVLTRADLDRIREEFASKLNPSRAPEVHDGVAKEIKLIDFRPAHPAHESFDEFKKAVKQLAESRNASISHWHEGAMKFSFQYRRGEVHGTVEGHLKPRYLNEFRPQTFDIILSVKEDRAAH